MIKNLCYNCFLIFFVLKGQILVRAKSDLHSLTNLVRRHVGGLVCKWGRGGGVLYQHPFWNVFAALLAAEMEKELVEIQIQPEAPTSAWYLPSHPRRLLEWPSAFP
jgi:hypothetical protein